MPGFFFVSWLLPKSMDFWDIPLQGWRSMIFGNWGCCNESVCKNPSLVRLKLMYQRSNFFSFGESSKVQPFAEIFFSKSDSCTRSCTLTWKDGISCKKSLISKPRDLLIRHLFCMIGKKCKGPENFPPFLSFTKRNVEPILLSLWPDPEMNKNWRSRILSRVLSLSYVIDSFFEIFHGRWLNFFSPKWHWLSILSSNKCQENVQGFLSGSYQAGWFWMPSIFPRFFFHIVIFWQLCHFFLIFLWLLVDDYIPILFHILSVNSTERANRKSHFRIIIRNPW